ncbi:MAG: hypothetical protein AAFV29_13060 [Myxococcota bacterium]
MFSEAGFMQEIVALSISAIAALYLFARLTGWPKFGLPQHREPAVKTGRRLARGLNKVHRQR